MCSLVLLLFLIGGYNTVLAMREQRDEIARLTAELEGSKMTVSALKEQQAKKTENTAAEALKGADAKNTDGGWKDGAYEGEGQGFGGKIVVEVTIAETFKRMFCCGCPQKDPIVRISFIEFFIATFFEQLSHFFAEVIEIISVIGLWIFGSIAGIHHQFQCDPEVVKF